MCNHKTRRLLKSNSNVRRYLPLKKQNYTDEKIRTALENAYSTGSFASTPLGESSLASDRMAFWTIL